MKIVFLVFFPKVFLLASGEIPKKKIKEKSWKFLKNIFSCGFFLDCSRFFGTMYTSVEIRWKPLERVEYNCNMRNFTRCTPEGQMDGNLLEQIHFSGKVGFSSTNFKSMFSFYTPWKHQKTKDFLDYFRAHKIGTWSEMS